MAHLPPAMVADIGEMRPPKVGKLQENVECLAAKAGACFVSTVYARPARTIDMTFSIWALLEESDACIEEGKGGSVNNKV